MFLKDSVFKKLLKEAYTGCGIRAAQTEDGIYTISGGYWILEVEKKYMDKAILGEIIKIIGELPEKGEGVRIIKGEPPQQMMADTIYMGLQQKYYDANNDDRYEPGRILVMSGDTPSVVFQHVNGHDHVLLTEMVRALILPEEKTTGVKLENPIKSDYLMIWSDDISCFACTIRPVRYQGEEALLTALADVDLCWANMESTRL